MNEKETEGERKFDLLYMKYKFLMQKVANDVLHDHFSAEDAVHNAFMNISKNMAKIGEIEDVKTKSFLITIVKNAAIDMYRKRRTQMQREIYVDEINEADIPRTFIESDIENMVLITIKNMPVKYSSVILLKYIYQLENKEIADLLKISECNVRLRIKRGKEVLQNRLKW